MTSDNVSDIKKKKNMMENITSTRVLTDINLDWHQQSNNHIIL